MIDNQGENTMAIAATIERYLIQHRVSYELVPHPITYSSRDTAKVAHVADDHIAKAVIVRDEQGYAMAVIPASHWVKLEAYKKRQIVSLSWRRNRM